MALILGVKIGDVIDVASEWVAVLSVDGNRSATLIGNGGRKISVSAKDMVQLSPDVWVGLGPELARSRLRLMFEAPRNIAIARRHG
jgi:hypothetical protein